MKRVFISYSRKNVDFAERLARDLSDAGLDVWIDIRKIQAGDSWRDEIFKGINNSEMMVVCLSPDSVASEWVRREIFLARSQHRFIIPVMVKDCFPEMAQYEETRWLADVQIVDFQDGYDTAFPLLLRTMPLGTSQQKNVDPTQIPNPFKGLESFQQTDAELFFGREDLIEKLINRLQRPTGARFLGVVGASGSGKSSLVRAGLIPSLRAGKLPGSDKWQIAIFAPGPRPTEALAARLVPVMAGARLLPEVVAVLSSGREALHQVIEGILSDAPVTSRFVLVVDQFEEVFTRASAEERQRFLELLHTAVTIVGGRTLVVITMRADFFDRLSAHPDFARLFEQENLLIATEMTPDNLRRSIIGPAEHVGLLYDPGLADRILEDVRQQPGSLPLLQFALKLLYEKREGRRLTAKAYNEIGGVRAALAQHAENVYNTFDSAQTDLMRRIMLRLVEVSETGEATRRRVPVTDLTFRGVNESAVNDIIDRLTAPETRLLIASRQIPTISGTDEDEDQEPVTTVEVSHEALIREWDRLAEWIKINEESLRFGSELLKAAQDWQKSSGDRAYLLTGRRLDRALGWLENADSTPLQRDFVQASAAERQRLDDEERARQKRELELAQQAAEAQRRAASRLRVLLSVVAVLAVIAVAAAAFAFTLRQQAIEAEALAVAEAERADANAQIARSRQLAAQASNNFDNQLDLSLLLSIEADNSAETSESRDALLGSLGYAPYLDTFLQGHRDVVHSVAISPDGSFFASSSADSSVIVWDAATRQRKFEPLTGHQDRILGVAISPDNSLIASVGQDRTVRFWNASDGTPNGEPLTGHEAFINTVTFSPDGSFVATGGDDTAVRLWNVADRAQDGEPLMHEANVRTLAFNPAGTILAVGLANGTVVFWDVETRTQVAEPLTINESSVNSVIYSPNGAMFATGSDSGEVIIWNAETYARLQTPPAPPDSRTTSVAFSPDSALLAFGSSNQTVTVWNIETRRPIGLPLDNHSAEAVSLAFTPDGQYILNGNSNGTLLLWDIQSRPLYWQALLGHTNGVLALDYTPDGRFVASSGLDRRIILWNTATRTAEGSFSSGQTDLVLTLDVSPDGRYVATGGATQNVVLWDIEQREVSGEPLTGHPFIISSLAFNADGTQLASGDFTGTIILWDVETRQPIGDPLRLPSGAFVASLAYNPSGTLLAVTNNEGAILFWNTTTREWEAESIQASSLQVNRVAFNPADENMLAAASADSTVTLWNVSTRQQIGEALEGHTQGVMWVSFSPDGRTLSSTGLDKLVILWDMTQNPITGTTLSKHEGGAYTAAFSPDGTELVTGGIDNLVIVWDITFLRDTARDVWEGHACRIANRNLTVREWERFLTTDYRETCGA
jgi:WD40 repeat protein